MSDIIEKAFEVRWDDVNANGHLRNTRYLDYASYARISYFQNAGFPVSRMQQMGLSMVALAEEAEYCNEVFLSEYLTVRARAVGLSADGTRWQVAHTFLHSDGKIAAILYTLGAWFDMKERKLTAPARAEVRNGRSALSGLRDHRVTDQYRMAAGSLAAIWVHPHSRQKRGK